MPTNSLGQETGSRGTLDEIMAPDAPEASNSVAPTPFQTLTYPLGLNPDNFYPEAMCFTIRKRIGLSLEEVTGAVGRAVEKGKQGYSAIDKISQAHTNRLASAEKTHADAPLLKKAAIETSNEIKRNELLALKESGGANSNLGIIVNAGKSFGKDLGSMRADKIAASKTTALDVGYIYLNMPQAISNTDSISWNATPLGAIGAITQSLGSGTGGGGDALKGAGLGNAGNIAGAGLGGMLAGLTSKLNIPGGIGLGAIVGALGGGAVQQGIEATMGMTSNPYEEMMFSGITFRSFSFDFIFRPESEKEITEVGNIIKMFRKYSRPSFDKGAFGKSVMNYPMEYGIEFLTAERGKDSPTKGGTVYSRNKHLPQIKMCVCENISTNYTPNSVWSAYAAGAPIAITMSLGFKEKELVMDTDIDAGY